MKDKVIGRRDALKAAAITGAAAISASIASPSVGQREATSGSALKGSEPTMLTLEEFRNLKQAPEIQAILGKLNGGTFMECHQKIFASTGIWIPELVPVFEKLDATLAFRNLQPKQ
jgi:hypothetical protein